MGIERLKSVKDQIMCAVEGQIHNLKETDTKEMSEAIDMLKDLSEAIYYCTITDSMEDSSPEEKSYYMNKYIPEYEGKFYTPIYYANNMGRTGGRRMYGDDRFDDKYKSRMYYTEPTHMMIDDKDMHDWKDGMSYMSRRGYMEAKENHADKSQRIAEIKKYAGELSEDIYEMIEDASPEEKAQLKQSIMTMMQKIV